jgi:hypothetical protein
MIEGVLFALLVVSGACKSCARRTILPGSVEEAAAGAAA